MFVLARCAIKATQRAGGGLRPGEGESCFLCWWRPSMPGVDWPESLACHFQFVSKGPTLTATCSVSSFTTRSLYLGDPHVSGPHCCFKSFQLTSVQCIFTRFDFIMHECRYSISKIHAEQTVSSAAGRFSQVTWNNGLKRTQAAGDILQEEVSLTSYRR